MPGTKNSSSNPALPEYKFGFKKTYSRAVFFSAFSTVQHYSLYRSVTVGEYSSWRSPRVLPIMYHSDASLTLTRTKIRHASPDAMIDIPIGQ